MNRLRIMLNNRKRFVFLAAMVAVLVLLAGGANALAAPTVWCVPNLSVNPSCTAVTPTPRTIQNAVNNAVAGDIILVGPGTYNERVTIDETGHSRDHLSLVGAQAGNDARVDRHGPESIVDAQLEGPAIIVAALAVVIDGFTVQNGVQTSVQSCGIILRGNDAADGAIVVNNIFQNNDIGVGLSVLVGPPLIGVLIEHNLFRNNNAGNSSNGEGILSGFVQHAIITENAFCGNKTSAIDVKNSSDVTITKNTSEKDGSFVIFTRTTNVVFSNNRGEDFGAKGAFSGAGDAAVAIGPGNQYLVISDNCLEEGKAPISNGIAFTTIFGPGAANMHIYVKNNKIKRFPGNGILAEETLLDPPPPGTVADSFILGNEVYDNGLDGIFIDGVICNTGNTLLDNEAEGNHRFDCHDDTTGLGTANTGNTWFHNTGKYMHPTGLCTPEKRHDHD